jgi:hypothetical protein
MPGGYGNITAADGKPFKKGYTPSIYSGRKNTKMLTDLLTKNLKTKKEITVTGTDILTGKTATVKIAMPTKEVIVGALLRQAAKGNINAIREVFDRVDGKTIQPVELNDGVKIHVTRS